MKISTEEIICENGMPAFLARPTDPAHHPFVILMHERYGLVQHTRDLAVRCARDGFVVLAPNLFFKHPDQIALNAGIARCDVSDPDVVTYLRAAMTALRDHGATDPGQIAVAGYCQTGRHPLVLAAKVPIAAAIVWYGAASQREWPVNEWQPIPLEEVIANIACPVFGAFGEADHIISLDDVRRFRDCLEDHRKSYDIRVYKGAPHGWLNDTMPGRYDEAQAQAGWAAQQHFLKEVFGRLPHGVQWRFESDIGADYDFSKNVRLE
jgi:carboxymethylenebutenolidase